MLELNNLSLTFNPHSQYEKKGLDHLSLTIEEGDFITLIGSNGAGKSTLFNVLSGAYEVDEGKLILEGKDITYMPQYQRAKFIGRLFQDPLKGTAPSLSVEENLSLAFNRGKKCSLFGKAIHKENTLFFQQLLQDLDLGLENRLKDPVGLLSGGQRQALTLCMATLVPPKLLLLDEHTAALDPKTSERVMSLTQKIVEKNQITTCMITHNIAHALQYGNKLVMMDQGRIVHILNSEQKKRMTPEKLVDLYSNHSKQGLSDRFLL